MAAREDFLCDAVAVYKRTGYLTGVLPSEQFFGFEDCASRGKPRDTAHSARQKRLATSRCRTFQRIGNRTHGCWPKRRNRVLIPPATSLSAPSIAVRPEMRF